MFYDFLWCFMMFLMFFDVLWCSMMFYDFLWWFRLILVGLRLNDPNSISLLEVESWFNTHPSPHSPPTSPPPPPPPASPSPFESCLNRNCFSLDLHQLSVAPPQTFPNLHCRCLQDTHSGLKAWSVFNISSLFTEFVKCMMISQEVAPSLKPCLTCGFSLMVMDSFDRGLYTRQSSTLSCF